MSDQQKDGKQDVQHNLRNEIEEKKDQGYDTYSTMEQAYETEQLKTKPQVSQHEEKHGEWTYSSNKKQGGIRTWVVGLCIVVTLGSLTYASDTNNWFTKNNTDVIQLNRGTNAFQTSSSTQVVRPGNISSIVKSTSAAIVKIETYQNQAKTNNFGNSFFDQFFSDEQQPSNQQGLVASGLGSGFIFDKAGYILTNQHVIEGADEIQVTVEGYKKPFKAKLLGSTVDLDLAVLKIEGTQDFSALKLGNDANVNVGDWLVAVGNPYGFDHTVTVGVLSAKERPIEITENNTTRKYKNLLQTDASINPGNSGGPLLNLSGEVIGINTAVSAEAQGIGFAIPMTTVNKVLDDLKNNVKIPKPYIGIYMSNIDAAWVNELKLANTDGVLVQSTVNGSPAAMAGMKAYDVIVSFNHQPVKDTDDLSEKIARTKVGAKISVGLIRDGKNVTTTLIIGNMNK